MEDVLEVYSSPYNKDSPVICMDEKPLQLLADARCKIKIKSGKPERIDNEYIRKGTCSIFLFTEPLSGWRYADTYEHTVKKLTGHITSNGFWKNNILTRKKLYW